MAELSPAAQAVLDVYWKNVGVPSALAKELGFTNTPLVAALRAVVKELKCFGITEKNILAIADELEAL
jgi:hypothetical protein